MSSLPPSLPNSEKSSESAFLGFIVSLSWWASLRPQSDSEASVWFSADHPWMQNAKTAPNVPLGETVRARLKQFSVMNKFKKIALRVSITATIFSWLHHPNREKKNLKI